MTCDVNMTHCFPIRYSGGYLVLVFLIVAPCSLVFLFMVYLTNLFITQII
jgi:hypothetical protein